MIHNRREIDWKLGDSMSLIGQRRISTAMHPPTPPLVIKLPFCSPLNCNAGEGPGVRGFSSYQSFIFHMRLHVLSVSELLDGIIMGGYVNPPLRKYTTRKQNLWKTTKQSPRHPCRLARTSRGNVVGSGVTVGSGAGPVSVQP